MGTVLSGHFGSALPASLRQEAGCTSQALSVARQLGTAVHAQAVDVFAGTMAVDCRVIAAIVVAAAVAVALGLRRDRPRA